MTVSDQQLRQACVLSQSVVVFSKNYLPMARINIKRAVVLLVTGRAEPVSFMNGQGTQFWKAQADTLGHGTREHSHLWDVPTPARGCDQLC